MRVQGGEEARAFSQSELPRKPPIDTHGRYTYNTCTGEEKKKKKEKRKKRKEKKVGRSEKVGIPTKVRKTASLIYCDLTIMNPYTPANSTYKKT